MKMSVLTVFVLITAVGVSFGGADLDVGAIIELPEKSAAALIAEGKATAVTPTEETAVALDKLPEGDNEPTEAEKQAKALDGQYKRDELYEAAKEAGVDIAFDAKKGEIVAAVIAQGFAGALIK
jgi:hypothetical protein